MVKHCAITLTVALSFVACSNSGSAPSPLPSDNRPVTASPAAPTQAVPPAYLIGAGDIADCSSTGAAQTARLLDRLDGTIFTTGDNAYPVGSADDYQRCYTPTWGRHRGRTRPSPGNHDYMTAGATGYFNYFGANAGPAGLGYYSYDVGAWHVISLNSEIDTRAGSHQEQWLRRDLATNTRPCTVAYWHKPLFSSGPHGGTAALRPLWRALYEGDAELVLNGHDHLYERFAPQDPDGLFDGDRGIRQFTVGTGGGERYERATNRPNSEVKGTEWGVLALTLEGASYRWEFVPVDGASFRDVGTGVCH